MKDYIILKTIILAIVIGAIVYLYKLFKKSEWL
jgi:hypothetical protein